MTFRVSFLKDEYFWGGAVANGTDMPICADSRYDADFTQGGRNQMMPLFLSSKGRYVWSEHPFRVRVEDGALCFDGTDFICVEAGTCLRDAYLAAMERHFPFNDTREAGKRLPREFFRTPQYNTWMEFTYAPTQQGVLDYAHAILDHGFPPGVLIIDEGWHTRYGLWQFDLHKFPDPAAMVDALHAMGFTVMLWVTPLVTCDGQDFICTELPALSSDGGGRHFLRTADGRAAIVKWWNGFSAILDLRKACDRRFLGEKLQRLMTEYGVDGFKFDGGSYRMYHPDNIQNGAPAPDHDPAALNRAWNDFGTAYRFHEFKDTFKGGGKASIQRLLDRTHSWDSSGIGSVIPCSLLQGLFGHPFICPDMIGGGEWSCQLRPDFALDETLFVRMAQLSALFPMMQFSWAPWRVLSAAGLARVRRAAQLFGAMTQARLALVEQAEATGEPIVRAMEYNHPHCGYAAVTDQFMLGRDMLVCPALTPDCTEREVIFPAGQWRSPDGRTFAGRQVLRLPVPPDEPLWFRRVGD